MLSQQAITADSNPTADKKASIEKAYAVESHALSALSEAEAADALAAELATVRGL